MITITGTNNKVVKDPLFLSARKFMQDRLAALEAAGPSKELDLARQRYTGLTHADVIIEPPVKFANGKIRACFVSRKTGFLRADMLVENVDIKLIFDEFGVAFTNIGDVGSLEAGIKNGTIGEGCALVAGEQVIIAKAENFTPEGLMKIVKDIYWDEVTVTPFPQMDPTTKKSGTFKVEAINITPFTFPVYIIEDIKGIA